ncbi:MAG: hypothetical protein R2709_15240 [Marmoricola sp.]
MTDQDVGSVGEEAAKLLGALGDWAKTQSGRPCGDNVAGLADGLGERLQDINGTSGNRRCGVPLLPGVSGDPCSAPKCETTS